MQTPKSDKKESQSYSSAQYGTFSNFDNAAMRNYLSQAKQQQTSPSSEFRSPNFDINIPIINSVNRTPVTIKEKALRNMMLGKVGTPEKMSRLKARS